MNLDNAAPKARCRCLVIQFLSVRQFGRAFGFPFFIHCGPVLILLKGVTGVIVKKRCESIRLGLSILVLKSGTCRLEGAVFSRGSN